MSVGLTFEQLKTLGHPLRLAILKHLMVGPATLSQLGEYFKETPAHIRHHLKTLEEAGLVQFTSEPPLKNHLEKYYRAASSALLINLAVLPETPQDQGVLVLASKDLAAGQLADTLSQPPAGFTLRVIPLNSLEGLVNLRQGVCQMATSHLLEPEGGGYNRSYVRHLFPGQVMAVVELFHREEGLIVRRGNPLGIHNLEDLTRTDVLFINRELGSGIRMWLDRHLALLGISHNHIRGYTSTAGSHAEVAQNVIAGKADVGLGIAAAAMQQALDFIPLFEEPYELVVPYELYINPRCASFFERISSGGFRASIRQLNGYSVPHTIGQVDIIA